MAASAFDLHWRGRTTLTVMLAAPGVSGSYNGDGDPGLGDTAIDGVEDPSASSRATGVCRANGGRVLAGRRGQQNRRVEQRACQAINAVMNWPRLCDMVGAPWSREGRRILPEHDFFLLSRTVRAGDADIFLRIARVPGEPCSSHTAIPKSRHVALVAAFALAHFTVVAADLQEIR